ncbi:MAG TPA: HAMP domain-containing sensor histidine kinase, partial [Aggregatilineales bacterium]|nr:HAMP domain-containing sensor histidine kinase [Aggregatilineales bacterium]
RDFITVRDRSFRPQVSEVAVKSGELPWRLLVLMDVSHYQRLNDNMMMFLQTVSHDLRSPLTAAKGFIDMMPMVGELNDKQMMMQDKVLTSIIDMTNLVEKVLDAGRLDPEMGGYQLRRDLCDPGKIVEKVVSTLTNAANKKDLYLKAEVASGVPVMNLDELMIERALMNLVENAIKYTPEGGEIVVQAVVEQNHLFLDVIDNGFGIPEDKQDSLFERGSRIRRTEHKAIRGSGLGLFIVKNVAQQHGGDAIIESEEGSGSRFRIRVPISGLNAPGGASE